MVEVQRSNKKRWQFILLLFLLLTLGFGLLYLTPRSQQQVAVTTPSVSISASASGKIFNGVPLRKLPPGFAAQGTVDDRYTMSVDPDTGETVINDALGSVGTNNTSVDGDRAQLAKDMIALEQYANQSRGTLKPEDYSWLKKMARLGIQLAFGAPGLSPDAQLPIKQGLLNDFHNISSHPTESLMHMGVFLTAEKVAQAAENAYQQMADLPAGVGVKSPFLAPDPLSPNIAGTAGSDPNMVTNYLPSTVTPLAIATFISDPPPIISTVAAATDAPVANSTVTAPVIDTVGTTPVANSTVTAPAIATATTTPVANSTVIAPVLDTATTTPADNSTVIAPAITIATAPIITTAPVITTATAPTTTVSPTATVAPVSVQQYYSSILGP